MITLRIIGMCFNLKQEAVAEMIGGSAVAELLVEVIGETKILVTTFPALETTCIEDDFENEINEDFLNEQIFQKDQKIEE